MNFNLILKESLITKSSRIYSDYFNNLRVPSNVINSRYFTAHSISKPITDDLKLFLYSIMSIVLIYLCGKLTELRILD